MYNLKVTLFQLDNLKES